MSAYSLNRAARALERALSSQFPEHTWIAEVRDVDRDDAAALLGRPLAVVDEAGSGFDDTDALAKRRARSTASPTPDHHNLKKSA